MKKLLLFALFLVTIIGPVLGQNHTQSLTFDDLGLGGGTATSGTYNQNDTFGFDIYMTFVGYNSYGLSLWLETETLNNFAGSLSITGFTYGTTFPDVIQMTPNPAPFDVTYGTSTGYRREGRDLGAGAPGEGSTFLPQPPGTYFVGHVSFSITGAQPGIYSLQSTTQFPDASEATDDNFMDNPFSAEAYTITIVPEPSTLALLVLAIASVGALTYRRRALLQGICNKPSQQFQCSARNWLVRNNTNENTKWIRCR